MIDFTAVEANFFAALGKPAGPEQEAFLNEACRPDADLRKPIALRIRSRFGTWPVEKQS